MKKVIEIKSETDTCQLAKILSRQIEVGDVLALSGKLGTGKTFFTQCICKFLGVTEYVSSPSYILLNEYKGKFDIAHFDLYRLSSLEEVLEIGLIEIMEQRLTIIEWYEIAKDILPKETIFLDFDMTDDSRNVTLRTDKILVME